MTDKLAEVRRVAEGWATEEIEGNPNHDSAVADTASRVQCGEQILAILDAPDEMGEGEHVATYHYCSKCKCEFSCAESSGGEGVERVPPHPMLCGVCGKMEWQSYFDAQAAPPAPTTGDEVRSCSTHVDCAAADAKARDKGRELPRHPEPWDEGKVGPCSGYAESNWSEERCLKCGKIKREHRPDCAASAKNGQATIPDSPACELGFHCTDTECFLHGERP